jgi:hypothetical protein
MENNLKPVIAAPPELLLVNKKQQHPYYVVNRIFVLAFSNDRAPITIPADDRRWFVIWSQAPRLPDDEAARLWDWYGKGGFEAVAGYLDARRLVNLAVQTGCDAIHPGYGFLSENAEFARRCAQAGLVFVGPRPETLALFGDKVSARAFAQALVEGHAGDDALVDRVHHDHLFHVDRPLARHGAHAQRVEGVEGVGPELDAGADLADLGRLLEHLDMEALAHQRQRGRQPADAAAGNQHGGRCGGSAHGRRPRSEEVMG